MSKVVDRLQDMLQRYDVVVYVDDGFQWKELSLSKVKDRPEICVVTDSDYLKLYRMYEFSDKFIVLSESEQYGSIWNYVRLGMISAEDALEQVLGA